MPAILFLPENIILFKAIGSLLIISGMGYLAVRCRLLSDRSIECLSRFVISIALPCLVISILARELHYELLPEMAGCLVAAVMLNGLGLIGALAMRRLFIPASQPGRRLFLSLASIQNSGYLPIPLVNAILPEGQRDTGLLFVFVYIFIMGFIFWSLGVWLITKPDAASRFSDSLRKAANPPMVAMVIGLLFLIPQVKDGFGAIPLLQEGLLAVGNTTIPLVLIILGGSFATVTPSKSGRLVIATATVMKLAIIPAIALSAAVLLRLEKIFVFALILQAAMPAAMNHIVVAQEYDGDVALTSRALLVQYLLSPITVSVFLLLYNRIYL